jgi:hypothetical protein
VDAGQQRAHVFWRVDGMCQEWLLEGNDTGTITRLVPAPGLRFDYRLTHGDLELKGDPTLGPTGEIGLESACTERVPLASTSAGQLSLGDGAWYWTREACMNASSLPAPGPCSAPLAGSLVSDASARSKLQYVYDHSGPIAMLTTVDGAITCETRTFRAQNSAHELVRSRKVNGTWQETATDVALVGDHLEIGEGASKVSLPVVVMSAAMVMVGRYPWFVDTGRCADFAARR